MAKLAAPPTTIHARLEGTWLPPPGWENTKNPERPNTIAEAPTHSRKVIVYPKYVPKMKTKNNNSMVKMGWTTERRPTWRAKACNKKEQTMKRIRATRPRGGWHGPSG